MGGAELPESEGVKQFLFVDQWERLRRIEDFDRKIDIEIRPVQVFSVLQFDMENLIHRGLPEPGVIFIWKEILPVPDKEPKAELIYICHFNGGGHEVGFLHERKRRIGTLSI
jgi:hypothetical protein